VDSEPDVIWGFNPHIGNHPLWLAMHNLRNHLAYPGEVTDDTHIFAAATRIRLRVLTFDIILPDPAYQSFEQQLVAERQVVDGWRQSRFTYGFPNGDGDCNCITWLERLALPLLSGGMLQFARMTASDPWPHRRFGRCI
jgi:hypothetical protein